MDSMFLLREFLLLMLCIVCCLATYSSDSEMQCSYTREQEVKFVLLSSQNDTGHWITQIQVDHGRGTVGQDGSYDVQIEQNHQLCNGTDPVLISGQLIEPSVVPSVSSGDYTFFPGLGFYKLHLTPKTWHEAKKTCEVEGTHLAIPNSKNEVMAILVIYAKHLNMPRANLLYEDQAYIGIHDTGDEGNFKTVFEKPLNSTGWNKWATHEPNNHDNEDCVTLKRSGRLNDVNCNIGFGFVCEKEL